MAEKRFAFPRNERLRKRRGFLEVYEKGEKVRTKYFFLYFLETELSKSRLGITVSRKTGSTVTRNRIKRRLREIFRKNKRLLHPPCDLVVNAMRSTGKASYSALEGEFIRAVERRLRP